MANIFGFGSSKRTNWVYIVCKWDITFENLRTWVFGLILDISGRPHLEFILSERTVVLPKTNSGDSRSKNRNGLYRRTRGAVGRALDYSDRHSLVQSFQWAYVLQYKFPFFIVQQRDHKRHRENSCNFTHFHSHFKFRIGETLVLTLSTKAARINYSELYFSLVPVLSLFGKKANSLIILSGWSYSALIVLCGKREHAKMRRIRQCVHTLVRYAARFA